MTSTLPIGDFSRATHLSVKMLRHYHELGLLEPADVDADTGYRRYAAEQIVTAQSSAASATWTCHSRTSRLCSRLPTSRPATG